MKKIFCISGLLIVWFALSSQAKPATASERKAAALVSFLRDFQQREDITPDCFFDDVLTLRQAIAEQTDSASRAIYRATLAHLLHLNAHRGQHGHRSTVSHPDSVQEWSVQEYEAHAAALYGHALRDMPLLHATPTKDWLPLVKRGGDEAVFASDMLYVVWQAYHSDFGYQQQEDDGLPRFADIIPVYEATGHTEAVVRLMLDSLRVLPHPTLRERLRLLRQEYEGSDVCALVYLHEAEQTWKADERKALLEEALRLYPASPWRSALRNSLAEVEAPHLACSLTDVYYPRRDMRLPLRVRNMQSAQFTIYRLPLGFEQADRPSLLEQVKRVGQRVDAIERTFAPHPAHEEWDDTLCHPAPDCGLYALVMQGTTSVRLANKPQPEVCLLRVSRLACFHATLPDGTVRIVAVDGLTGQPLPGVTVEVRRRTPRSTTYKTWKTLTSDDRGYAHFASEQGWETFEVRLSRPGDEAQQAKRIGIGHTDWTATPRTPLHIYTDRSIYRPGQTVYVGALAYTQEEWDAQVERGKDYTLTFYDAGRIKLLTHSLRTDTLGVLADSLVLPTASLPGTYRIEIGGSSQYIKVEEYRRPTFRVELPERGAAEVQDDSVSVEGCATTYSGVPLAGARVTGSFGWTRRVRPYSSAFCTPLADTVLTDSRGHFSFRVPCRKAEDGVPCSWMLRASVDVLSPEGETQTASQLLSVCPVPLYLWAEGLPALMDKDRLTAWHFGLSSPSQANVEADVLCHIRRGSEEVCVFAIPAGKPTVPQQLAGIPSGQYSLRAEVRVAGDTASLERDFMLISMDDKRLAAHRDLWLYTPCDTFSVGAPARLQLGSSLGDAWLFCTLTAESGLGLDTLVHLSDTLLTWDIPYRDSYGKGASFDVRLYHDGRLLAQSQTLHLKKPDIALGKHWDTFRNHLRPGQHEEWRLTLTRPDGRPASANVMLGIYDASLDALQPHHIAFSLSRPSHIRALSVETPYTRFASRLMILDQQLRLLPVKEPAFSHLDEGYFGPRLLHGRAYGIASGRRMAKAMMAGSAFDGVLESTVTANMMDTRATMKAMAGGVEEAEAEDDAEERLDEAAPTGDIHLLDGLRTNLSELAFFKPTLRTDPEGHLSIAFTLPEGLTSWHLQGFAHTADLMSVGFDETIVAQKELMAELQLPRFLRSGDEAVLTASLRNVSDRRQEGVAEWVVMDGSHEEGKVLKRLKVRFALAAHADTVCTLSFGARMAHPLLVVKWMAASQDASDGEQRYLPVLSDQQQVTRTKAFFVADGEQQRIDLQHLFPARNATDKALTIEYVPHPLWLAVECLPSLAAPVADDVMSLATAYYAGSLGYHLAHKYDIVRQVADGQHQPASQPSGQPQPQGRAQSPLAGNQELTGILLRETPWVVEAEREKAQRERLTTFFQDVEQEMRRMAMLTALGNRQMEDGSFAWFAGMRGSGYMTTEVAYLLTRLGMMTGESSGPEQQMLSRAVGYLVEQLSAEVAQLRKQKEPHVGWNDVRTLYILYGGSHKLSKQARSDVDYLLSLLRKDAQHLEGEERALAAIVLHKAGARKEAAQLMPRLHQLLGQRDGTYLAYQSGTFTPIDRKLQAHVQVMEAIRLVEPSDTATLMGMEQWLIQQKRTQEWDSPALSANAIYALLQHGTSGENASCDVSSAQGQLFLESDGKRRQLQGDASASAILRERVEGISRPKALTVSHQGEGVAWGAVYAQCLQPAADVEAQHEGLTIRRDISQEGPLRVGDRVHVRYTITADRDYEFVRLVAPRPAAAEPATQLSGYRHQGGLGYYMAVYDARSEYFVDSLPRGTYVVEEDWLVSQAGSYLASPARVQCLYAPEYQSTSAGASVSVTR